MPRSTRLAAVATVVAATLAVGLMQTAASGAVRPAFAGGETFKIVARNPGPLHPVVYAWGAFKATGHYVRFRSAIVFPRGRIIVRRHVKSTTYHGPNLTTCRFRIVQKGTFAVRRATGRYRHLHESGHFTSRLFGRLKKTGTNACGTKIVSSRTVTYEIGRTS